MRSHPSMSYMNSGHGTQNAFPVIQARSSFSTCTRILYHLRTYNPYQSIVSDGRILANRAIAMLPSSLLLVVATFLAPLARASSAPACAASNSLYSVSSFRAAYFRFCTSNPKAGPTSINGLDINYTFNGTGCDTGACSQSFHKLVSSCQFNNHTIAGTGSIDAGCGTYKFSVPDQSVSAPIPSSTSNPAPSQTGKLEVGTTALGNPGSGAGIAKMSGGLMIGVASVFIIFF
ncbi:hypothetical protein B0O99DRAFT_237880 [Bisporella sp. PMI_857]|nr:hypothetical protein B0O99DRAFT_237880 [Bisporella sp. PMI_857]